MTCAAKGFVFKKDSLSKIRIILKTDILLPPTVLTNPTHYWSFTFEKTFGSRHSFQLTYWDVRWTQTIEQYDYKTTYNYLLPEYKFFFKRGQKGYYVGGTIYLQKLTEHTNEPHLILFDLTNYSMGAGIINGFQFYPLKHFVIDFLAGIGGVGVVHSQGPDYVDDVGPIVWRAAINVGYKF
jgi:hypothetical protein